MRMLFNYYSGLGGGELLHLASQNNSGQQADFGDWLGFISLAVFVQKTPPNQMN